MTVITAQAKVKTETAPELQAAAGRLFAAIETVEPEGIRYAWLLLPDGETFVAVVQVDDGVENPIPDLPEYQELQQVLQDSIVEAPTPQALTVLGSYRLF